MNADGPLSIVDLLWCLAFAAVFGAVGALAIEAVKTAWRIVRRASREVG